MMTGFIEQDGILHVDGIPLPEIAQACGTPCYIYSAGQISENIKNLQDAFTAVLPAQSRPLIAFACKANSNIAVLSRMKDMGLGADVVSGGELLRARHAGINSNKIVFSGVGKTDDEIKLALSKGVLQINVESAPELERIAQLAKESGKKAPVALRFNPDVDAGTHAKITTGKSENKFGLQEEEIISLYEKICADPHLTPRGLSIHIGSQLTAMEPFAAAFKKLAGLAKKLQEKNLSVPALDCGGGLGIVYRSEQAPCLKSYATLVRDIIHPLGTDIIIEPGRFLTGNAGVLLSRVIYIKHGRERKYMILDAGMNDLMRPALYDAWHPVRPVETREGDMESYDIVGPVCETGDTFAIERMMPPTQRGDLIAIMAAGAYGFTMASNYNSRPLPPEILTENGKYTIIRQRQDIHDILEEDILPDMKEQPGMDDARSA